MEPEWKAYQVSAHAKVSCVSCHVGPGAEALIQSKITGSRQLWQIFTNNVPTPVPAPVHNMRPARDTCMNCHWGDKDHGDKLKVIREYADDEKSSETATTLQLHIGGGRAELGAGSGIHWHMNIDNKIEFIATDPQRQTIPWVKFTDRAGNVKEFAVDNAIAAGHLPNTLAFARREAVSALKDVYPNADEARRGIDARLRKAFASHQGDPSLDRMVDTVQDLYGRNVFPAMKVSWGTYPNNIGHVFFPGCFRCHDDNHKSKDGSVIKQDCESCHAMP
jgi:hypothetical protein